MFSCEGGLSERTTIPVSWTDRNPPPSSNRLTIEALISLIGLITALSSTDDKGEV